MKFTIVKKLGSKIVSKVGPKAGKLVLLTKKNSPQILLGVGIAAGITCVVVACKETYEHLGDIVDDHKDAMSDIEKVDVDKDGKPINMDSAQMKAYRRAVVKQCARTTGQVIKLYLPAAALGTISIVAIFGSHRIMLKRVASLAAAYTAVDEAFKDYRARVVEKYGEEEDYKLRYGITEEEVAVSEKAEDGTVKEVNKKILMADLTGHSQYAKFFDQSCSAWEKNPDYNYCFLKAQQEYFNHLLQAKGYVFLNDVYDALGIERTSAGQVVGWIKGAGDDYIDFGLYSEDEATRRFVNGLEPVVLLDFNVDGVIYDKI